jgi:antitoxin (DNA-binding transcriptional repressor) of toxin-antitoxin stability system
VDAARSLAALGVMNGMCVAPRSSRRFAESAATSPSVYEPAESSGGLCSALTRCLAQRTFDVYRSGHELKHVKVTVLRQNLPQYLARVRRGERLRVTSRGWVIAELTPPSAAADDAEAARERLRGSVRRYERPLAPAIEPGEWDANR